MLPPKQPICLNTEHVSTAECALRTALRYAEEAPRSILCPVCIMGRIRDGSIPIHRAVERGRNELLLLICDESLIAPKHGEAVMQRSGSIFQSTDDRFYTFSETAITCPTCISKCPN